MDVVIYCGAKAAYTINKIKKAFPKKYELNIF
jgi:hypothetical protein